MQIVLYKHLVIILLYLKKVILRNLNVLFMKFGEIHMYIHTHILENIFRQVK